jgi:hypothetical protein
MTTVTLDRVLAQARALTPDDQARLITALLPTASAEQAQQSGSAVTGENDDDAAEQRETWAYLQRVLDEDRLSDRPLFPIAPRL